MADIINQCHMDGFKTVVRVRPSAHTVDLSCVYTRRDRQRDMLPRDLLCGNGVYMVGSCRARLLHIIHVSAVSEVGVLKEKCSRQPVPRGNYKFKLKMPPGLAAVARLLRAACRRVNAPVVFLCFYFAARLSRRSRAACRVPCKRSLMSLFIVYIKDRHNQTQWKSSYVQMRHCKLFHNEKCGLQTWR